jgi:hypothetical protein
MEYAKFTIMKCLLDTSISKYLYGCKETSHNTQACVYVCMYVCIYIYIYICVCVCVCVYIYIYIHTHIHTYIHMYVYPQPQQILLVPSSYATCCGRYWLSSDTKYTDHSQAFNVMYAWGWSVMTEICSMCWRN